MLYLIDLTQYAWNKILLVVGSFIGVSIANSAYVPPYMRGNSASKIAIMSASVAAGLAFTVGGMLLIYFGVDPSATDVVLFVGGCIGLFSPFGLNLLRNTALKHEDKTLSEVAKEVKDTV